MTAWHDVRFYLRSPSLDRIGQIEPMTFTAQLRFNAVSSWTMQVPRTDRLATELLFGQGYGIYVHDDDRVLLSGFIDHKETRLSAGEDAIYIAGPDDTTLLADRTARPVPTGPPYTAAAYDVRTGDAGTVLVNFVKFHVQDSSVPAARRVANLTLPSPPTSGVTGTWRARFQNLLSLCAEIAQAGGLGFRITQSLSTTDYVLSVYVPQDKSDTALFSVARRNITSYDYVKNAPEANHLIAGGQGDLTARAFAEVTDAAALTENGRFIETFYDRTDVSNTTELAQVATTELSSKTGQRTLTLEPSDTPQLQYGIDYDLGDIVTVVIDNNLLPDVVREVSWTWTRDGGRRVVPTIGSPNATDVADIFNDPRIVDLLARVRQLERAH